MLHGSETTVPSICHRSPAHLLYTSPRKRRSSLHMAFPARFAMLSNPGTLHAPSGMTVSFCVAPMGILECAAPPPSLCHCLQKIPHGTAHI